jgi:hypothetical protein
LEVVLVIDELRVISFDKLSMKMPSSVAYDDLVNVHLSYLTHLMTKQSLLSTKFEMPMVGSLPQRQNQLANEERSSFYPFVSSSNNNANNAQTQNNQQSEYTTGRNIGAKFQSPDAKSLSNINDLGGSTEKGRQGKVDTANLL